jgi:hypothetical protein
MDYEAYKQGAISVIPRTWYSERYRWSKSGKTRLASAAQSGLRIACR